MKTKELKEYKNKPEAELLKDIRVKREALTTLKFDLTLGKVKNIKEIRGIKKSIAQIATILKERSQADEPAK